MLPSFLTEINTMIKDCNQGLPRKDHKMNVIKTSTIWHVELSDGFVFEAPTEVELKDEMESYFQAEMERIRDLEFHYEELFGAEALRELMGNT